MSSPDPRRIAAVETGTGIMWADWLDFFEPHRELDHTAMAKLALDYIRAEGNSRSPEWWAQGVTVAYEQHIGRRKVGEQCDGSFAINASKTLPGTMDEILGKLVAAGAGRDEFAGIPIASEPTTSATEKWRYWRVKLDDGSRVSINVQQKPTGNKSVAAVNHDGLDSDAGADALKAWWRDYLGSL